MTTNQEQLPLSIPQGSSEALAAAIVAHRALGFNKDYAILAMKELMRRRQILGEEFDFETWIETELAKIPKIEGLNIDNLMSGLNDTLSAFTAEKKSAK